MVLTCFKDNNKLILPVMRIFTLANEIVPLLVTVLRLAVADFPGGTVVKNPPANARDTGSSLGLGRSHVPWSN